MLAQIADDFDEVLAAHGGTSALEYKYDGARIQLHRDGERIRIWTRGLSDVTASLPDVVETARRELTAAPLILDGEVLALDAGGAAAAVPGADAPVPARPRRGAAGARDAARAALLRLPHGRGALARSMRRTGSAGMRWLP